MALGTRYTGTGHIPGDRKWQTAAPAGGIIDTTDDVLAAAVAGVQAHCVALQIFNSDATVDTEVVVKDGSTVIWRIMVPGGISATLGLLQPTSFTFPLPLRASTNTALNVAAITTAAEVYVNAQGYYA